MAWTLLTICFGDTYLILPQIKLCLVETPKNDRHSFSFKASHHPQDSGKSAQFGLPGPLNICYDGIIQKKVTRLYALGVIIQLCQVEILLP